MNYMKSPRASHDAEDDWDFHEDIDDGRAYTQESMQAALSAPPNARGKGRRGAALLGSLLVLALALGAVVGLSSIRGSLDNNDAAGRSDAASRGPTVGSPAPDFELADVNTGQPVKLSSLRGKPVWINFWASWCPPCKVEMPIMKQVYAKYESRGLVIVGVDMREKVDEVKQFTATNGYDWTFVIDSDGQVTDRYFVSGIPSHYFIGKDGVINSIRVGEMTAGEMEENVSKIIER